MDVVWDSPDEEITGRDVADALPGHAYTTLVTVLDRLSHKGLVHRTLVGRINVYRGRMTRAAFVAGAMLDVLDGTPARDEALRVFMTGLGAGDADAVADALAPGTARERR